jgi:DNA-binding NtrC family response regulator
VADFVSTSDLMRRLSDQVERLRDADCSVLILGETGTGKTVLARKIHRIGARGAGPFVDVNCATFSRDLVESELFGHERGAFTGAHAQKTGLFDAADQGTLFLDEIGDIDVQVQPKILKVLEDKRFRRVGSVREREVDVRLVAATHHDLLAAVARKSFRADLYYRVSTVTLSVPALRERREDLLPLARHVLVEQCGEPVGIARAAEEKLLSYAWPGNIRELKNVLERALLLRTTNEIREADIRLDVDVSPAPRSPSELDLPAASSSRLGAGASSATRDEIEREHIQLALDAENGRVEAAARRLGMPRSTLYLKIKHYQMSVGRSAKSEKPSEP